MLGGQWDLRRWFPLRHFRSRGGRHEMQVDPQWSPESVPTSHFSMALRISLFSAVFDSVTIHR